MALEALELALRLLLAAGLGSLIWAGLRLHLSLPFNACLFTIVSALAFANLAGATGIPLDPWRLALQLVPAVGVLAAGASLLGGDVLKWVATAAGFSAVAIIGFALGSGHALAASVTTVLMVFSLAGIQPAMEGLKAWRDTREILVRVTPGALSIFEVNQALGMRAHNIARYAASRTDENVEDVRITFTRVTPGMLAEIVADLKRWPGTLDVPRA